MPTYWSLRSAFDPEPPLSRPLALVCSFSPGVFDEGPCPLGVGEGPQTGLAGNIGDRIILGVDSGCHAKALTIIAGSES
jgi:hypothetical protein